MTRYGKKRHTANFRSLIIRPFVRMSKRFMVFTNVQNMLEFISYILKLLSNMRFRVTEKRGVICVSKQIVFVENRKWSHIEKRKSDKVCPLEMRHRILIYVRWKKVTILAALLNKLCKTFPNKLEDHVKNLSIERKMSQHAHHNTTLVLCSAHFLFQDAYGWMAGFNKSYYL